MKLAFKIATLALMTIVVSQPGVAAPTAVNLARGVIGPVSADSDWANYSVFNIIPGSALLPAAYPKSVFYLGFTGGSEAEIGNMVVYTTARGSSTITAVTPVTRGGSSSPTIDLASPSVCAVAPSTSTPCIVRLDPTTLAMSPASDYYLVVFFVSDTNNASIIAAQANSSQSSFAGTYVGGTNYTQLTVGEAIPVSMGTSTNFLMYVMSD